MSRDILERLASALPRQHTLISTATGVTSGGDLIPGSLLPDHTVSNLRTVVQFGGVVTALKLRMHDTDIGTIDGDVLKNSSPLQAGIFHIFDFPVNRPFQYNLIPTGTATLTFLQIHESGYSST